MASQRRAALLQTFGEWRARPWVPGALRMASRILVALAALFLVIVAHRHWSEISQMALSGRQWLVIAGLAFAYGCGLILLGLAWHLILTGVGAAPPNAVHSIQAHTIAQLAKYVPGNVFHFVGRHLIHRAAGLDDRKLAVAVIVENVVLLLAAAAVASACLLVAGSGPVRLIALVAAIALVGTLALAAPRIVRGRGWLPAPLLCGFALAVMFFAVMAAVIGALSALVGAARYGAIAGGGVAAWVAGFVTPGAPGGLGVREAVMVMTGGGVAGPEALLLIALLFRIVTFAGDLVCSLIGRFAFREPHRHAQRQ